MSRRRVVVTGLGVVSPVGSSVASAWESILAGRSGIAPITRFDASRFTTRFGGAVDGFNVDDYLPPKEARKMDAFMHYGFAASRQAIEDAVLEITPDNAHRIGVAVGAGIGGIETIEIVGDAEQARLVGEHMQRRERAEMARRRGHFEATREFQLAELGILGNIYKHRSGASRFGYVKCLGEDLRNLFGTCYLVVPFRCRR